MQRLLLILFLLSSFCVSAQWTNAVLDSLTHNHFRDEINQNCFDINSQNGIDIIYKRINAVSGWDLYHKHYDATTGWSQPDTVTTRIVLSPSMADAKLGSDVSVAFDSDEPQSSEIFVSSNAGGGWNIEQLTNDTIDDSTPSIDLDGAGFAHVAWTTIDSAGDYKIEYATNRSGAWVTQILYMTQLGSFGNGAYPCIAVDNSGIANITYRGETAGAFRIFHIYNDIPGGNTWTSHSIVTQNGEDLSSVIEIDDDTVAHILVSGDDGFGFPVKSFYVSKAYSSPSYSTAIAVAPTFSAQVGDIFIDLNKIPHFVLNEISGNIQTGNIIYADSNDFNGNILLNTADLFSANLVIDEQDHAYLAAYQGVTFDDEEIVIYGYQSNTSMNDLSASGDIFRVLSGEGSSAVILENNFDGNISCTGIDGRKIYSSSCHFQKGETIKINSAAGLYIFTAENANEKHVRKIAVR